MRPHLLLLLQLLRNCTVRYCVPLMLLLDGGGSSGGRSYRRDKLLCAGTGLNQLVQRLLATSRSEKRYLGFDVKKDKIVRHTAIGRRIQRLLQSYLLVNWRGSTLLERCRTGHGARHGTALGH